MPTQAETSIWKGSHGPTPAVSNAEANRDVQPSAKPNTVCERWTLEELCELGEPEMGALLEGYKEGRVVTLKEIRGETEDEEVWESAAEDSEDEGDREVFHEAFDGSFGWF